MRDDKSIGSLTERQRQALASLLTRTVAGADVAQSPTSSAGVDFPHQITTHARLTVTRTTLASNPRFSIRLVATLSRGVRRRTRALAHTRGCGSRSGARRHRPTRRLRSSRLAGPMHELLAVKQLFVGSRASSAAAARVSWIRASTAGQGCSSRGKASVSQRRSTSVLLVAPTRSGIWVALPVRDAWPSSRQPPGFRAALRDRSQALRGGWSAGPAEQASGRLVARGVQPVTRGRSSAGERLPVRAEARHPGNRHAVAKWARLKASGEWSSSSHDRTERYRFCALMCP